MLMFAVADVDVDVHVVIDVVAAVVFDADTQKGKVVKLSLESYAVRQWRLTQVGMHAHSGKPCSVAVVLQEIYKQSHTGKKRFLQLLPERALQQHSRWSGGAVFFSSFRKSISDKRLFRW